MTGGGVLDRLMRSSVERAMKMQPRRTQKMADEYLYASPSGREEVAELRAVGKRLVDAGLSPAFDGSIAVRRSDRRASVTHRGADLGAIDNRSMESVDLADRSSPALAGLRAGAEAAIYAYPPHLLALTSSDGLPDPTVSDLADRAGDLAVVSAEDDIRTGLTVLTGRGVVATHDTPSEALARLEAAEMLARITIIRQNMRRNDG